MTATKITNYQRYTEALRMATEAAALLDEVASELKLARIHAQARGYRRPTASDLSSDADSLLEDIKAAECDDCGQPLSKCDCEWLGRAAYEEAQAVADEQKRRNVSHLEIR